MILHVASLDKFIPPYVDLINQEFVQKNHFFHIYGDTQKYPIQESSNIATFESSSWYKRVRHYITLIPKLYNAEKVMLHGLFDIRLVILLVLMPWCLNKCYWVIWGGDLYQCQNPKKRIRDRIKEIFRGFVIKRISCLVTYIPGDVELARKWYGAQGEYKECLMYLSNVIDEDLEAEALAGDSVNILVGNSASPSNNHFEVFEQLTQFKTDNIKIFVPLSYGSPAHAKAVIDDGVRRFGDKFYPITSFLPLLEYKFFLQSIDIAVFNHKRQQAMGNIITLLSMGKTVYVRNETSHRDFLQKLGITIKDFERFSISTLSEVESNDNKSLITEYFSKKNLIEQWSLIFKG